MQKNEEYILIHNTSQEEKRKELEKIGDIKMMIHPAGGFNKENGFVYEPIGSYRYVFYFKGVKGIGLSKRIAFDYCPACGELYIKNNGNKGDSVVCQKCNKKFSLECVKWELDVGMRNIKIEFNGQPISIILYNVPKEQSLKYWLNNDIRDEDGKPITFDCVFEKIKNYYKSYFDFPIGREVDLLALATIESWLTEILDVLFYVTVNGETGSGKTALLEAMAMVCRHGMVAASIKSAGIARVTERYKLSLFIDEIDKLKSKEDDIEGICRQGYRRGQKFIRMQPKSLEPEFFDLFGFKAFSFRSEIADDLQNRSIDIPLAKSKDPGIPILNIFKQFFNPFELIFFWYLENVANIYIKTPSFSYQCIKDVTEAEDSDCPTALNELVNSVNTVNKVNIVNVNNNIIYTENRESLSRKVPIYITALTVFTKLGIFGRNIEIAYLLFSLSEMLKFNLNEVLEATLSQKQQMEDASKDVGWTGILKEILTEEYNFAEMKDGAKFVPYSKVMKSYAYKMRDLFGNIPSEYQLKKLLRQLGFIDGVNRRILRFGEDNKTVALCLIYDKDVKKLLGVE